MMAEAHGMSQADSENKCPECHGNGWLLYMAAAPDVYDDCVEDITMAKPCPRCRGGKLTSPDRTGVPDQYHDCDVRRIDWGFYKADTTAFRKMVGSFVGDFSEWQKACKGLYIWSKTPGSGKTWMACCMAKSVMMKYDLRLKFVTVVDYIAKVGEAIAIQKSGGFGDPSKIYRECDLLILDDIGAQMDKDWQRQELFKLINARQGKVTIYTSNFPVADLKLDDRTISRIQKGSVLVHVPEESVRGQIAQKEQDEFIAKIMRGE